MRYIILWWWLQTRWDFKQVIIFLFQLFDAKATFILLVLLEWSILIFTWLIYYACFWIMQYIWGKELSCFFISLFRWLLNVIWIYVMIWGLFPTFFCYNRIILRKWSLGLVIIDIGCLFFSYSDILDRRINLLRWLFRFGVIDYLCSLCFVSRFSYPFLFNSKVRIFGILLILLWNTFSLFIEKISV